jgi:DNA polymerase eta
MVSQSSIFWLTVLNCNRDGLIAINYAARKFGLSRHIDRAEARKLCPELIMQHVATWKEGDEKWAYHEDAAAHIATHKVSLDPYRQESRLILACIKEALPSNLQRVEKAGIDEVFLDLSAQVHSVLLERYPELSLPAPYDDPSENLPLPPITALDWKADALVDLDTGETEDDDPDWDDVAILIGSEIVRHVRAAVREKLKYTCSGGVAHNKMLSKLGSAHRKPNQQTVIRNRAIQQFLSDFKFTKIRNLGGKLGEQVVSSFNTDTVKDLLPVSVEQLKQKLGDDSGSWVYQTIRGIDLSEVNSRTQIKSMLSAKSFRPSINSFEQAVRWLRIFVADIFSRLVEEGVLENKRRPKVINLHHRQGGQTKSRQSPIPQGKIIDEPGLFDLAKNLLSQIILEGKVWPCANLSLSVTGFEDGITGNMGIGSFLVKGEEAKALRLTMRDTDLASQPRAEKRQRADTIGHSIHRFFNKTDSTEDHDDDFDMQFATREGVSLQDGLITENAQEGEGLSGLYFGEASTPRQPPITDCICLRCNKALESETALQSHNDWHFAKDLQEEDRKPSFTPPAARSSSAGGPKRAAPSGRKSGSNAQPKIEKGQSKLSFG